MIFGILGKGGSGKTSTATFLVKHLSKMGNKVLAIDADHNMDLAYNLEAPESVPYFGRSLPAIKSFLGINKDDSYKKAFESPIQNRFTLTPADSYTSDYSVQIDQRVRLMVAGPHTDEILFDKSCSHILTTPLKVYLPFLKLGSGEFVIVDEKAGLDGVGTGVTTGFHAALVVAEPTPHSIKAARGIIELLNFYETPHGIVLTKSKNATDQATFKREFGDKFITSLASDMSDVEQAEAMASILAFGSAVLASSGDTREHRTRTKLERNAQYQMQH